MGTPLVDLVAQYNSIEKEISTAINCVLSKGSFILGDEVRAFEKEMATYCGTVFAIAVASGTDALHLALLSCGIKPGDEVITTPFTFIATSEAIVKCGAVPVFADIEPATFNIDPDEISKKITSRTRAIIPVHLYGQSVNMGPIMDLAKKHNLKVIEDCAQSFGAEYRGKKVGSIGDAGCLSFFPSKILGAYGDGGMIVTDNSDIMEKVVLLRSHGVRNKYISVISGFNSRLDEVQAAVLRVKLKYVDGWIVKRCDKASYYSNLLKQVEWIDSPPVSSYSTHVFNYYTIRLNCSAKYRNPLGEALKNNGIATAIYYPLSLHLQPIYEHLGYQEGDFPNSEEAQSEVLSLPLYPEIGYKHIRYIADIIEKYGRSVQHKV